MTALTRRYRFEAAHVLHGLKPGHKCGRLHGHNYTVLLKLSREHLDNGMVLDAEALDVYARPIVKRLDHQFLNELGGTDPDQRRAFAPMNDQPTAENIAKYLWAAMQFVSNDGRARLVSVRVQENEDLWAEEPG